MARSQEIGNVQRNSIRLGLRARLPSDAQDRAQLLVKAFKLARIGRQSLKIECLFKNRACDMKTLKSAPHSNLKDHTIAVVRHPCPYKRTAVHKASEDSPYQYARGAHCAHWYFKIVTFDASEFSRQAEYCSATRMLVDWVRTFDVVPQRRPMTGEHAMTTSSPSLSHSPPVLHVFEQDGGWHWGITIPRCTGSGFKLIAFSEHIFSAEDTAQRDGDRALASIVASGGN